MEGLMAYTALYRKWRPVCFEEVKGQEPIVNTLRNQITGERIGHAYLFCGTRGTGKTSIAKIFARAVNCEHPVNGSPCNECPTCKSILAGTSMNVVEIDAASNNGVENIREIRDDVRYSPTEGRYRVYIIDEVHMLSTGAFNALLKTLEEPPSYVIFILATTESHKIPITVLSRCQRYDFRRITNDVLCGQIARLCKEEGVSAEPAALRYVAQVADGSMRDALSLLEQCISFYYGKTLTYDNVLEVLGAVDTSIFSQLLRFVLNYDVGGAMACVEELVAQGRDLAQFTVDFTWYLRNLLLMQTTDPAEDTLNISADNMEALKEEALMTDTDTLIRYIRIFSELGNQIKYATSKRVLLEVALVKLMKPAMELDLESLKQRVNQLEEMISNIRLAPSNLNGILPSSASRHDDYIGYEEEYPSSYPEDYMDSYPDPYAGVAFQGNEPAYGQVQAQKSQSQRGSVTNVTVSNDEYADYQMLKKDWSNIIEQQERLIKSSLKGTAITFDKEKGFQIIFYDGFMKEILEKQNRLQNLQRWISEHYGKEFHFTLVYKGNKEPLPNIVPRGNRIEGIDMDIGEEL